MTSATLYRLSDGAERLFWRLIVLADDFGRLEAEPQILKNRAFPLWPDRVMPPRRVEKFYHELEDAGLVQTYIVKGERFGFFVTWKTHQPARWRRGTVSKFPEPTVETYESVQARTSPYENVLLNDKRITRSEKREARSEESANAKNAPAPAAPSPTPSNGHHPIEFRIPASVLSALTRAPLLGAVMRLRDPAFWQAELRANPGVDLAGEVLKAEAYITANPNRAPHKDFARFLHSWFGRAERDH